MLSVLQRPKKLKFKPSFCTSGGKKLQVTKSEKTAYSEEVHQDQKRLLQTNPAQLKKPIVHPISIPPAMSCRCLSVQEPSNASQTAGTTAMVFISGPLEADAEYFNSHYALRIRESIRQGHSFVVGPSRGIDTLAFNFLREERVSQARITVYLNHTEAPRLRSRFKRFELAGGRVIVVRGSHTQRDEAMTRVTHYDILRYRTEEKCRALYGAAFRKRISGTEKNELRRKSEIGLEWTQALDL